MTIEPGYRNGRVIVPRSKSHEHRLLIADFLAGDYTRLADGSDDSDDVRATKRCLRALQTDNPSPLLDCGESGSTRRFLGPLAAVLGKRPTFRMSGRLAVRPQLDYAALKPGVFELAGDISSQFVTGLLFALPLLEDESHIRFSSPLQSRGYVAMTLQVLKDAGIRCETHEGGLDIPGRQVYHPQPDVMPEGDWSSAAFWLAMNALGSKIEVNGLPKNSMQPDRVVGELIRQISMATKNESVRIDVADCPDLFPVLAIVAGASPGVTRFTGTRRLRFKESDRMAAMAEVLERFGVKTEMAADCVRVFGKGTPLTGGRFSSFGDHRVAMSIAVGATVANGAVEIDNVACAAKSYPAFFADLEKVS